jgi:hypothetical protein
MRFAMLINNDESEWAAASPDELEASIKEIYAWFDKWAAEGKIGDGGARLQASSTAKTVRAGADGRPVVTDGPYLELKEVIGGFVLLNVENIDEAVALASTWPSLQGSTSLEVRPIHEM